MAFPSDTSRFSSIDVDNTRAIARPVGAIIFDTVSGQLMRSTDAVTSTYVPIGATKLFASLADSTTLTALAAPTAFDVVAAIAAGTLQSGSLLRVTAIVRSIAVNGGATLQYSLRCTDTVGTDVLVASTAINVGANNRVLLSGTMLFRDAPGAAVGASSYFASSDLSVAAVTAGPAAGAVLLWNTLGVLTFDVIATHSTNNAGNQSVLESLVVEMA